MEKEMEKIIAAREALNALAEQGILEVGGAEFEALNKKEKELKEKKVLDVHDHAITTTKIVKNGKEKVVYQTRTDGHGRPRCSSYDALIDKLYDMYFGTEAVKDYSIGAIYEKALEYKVRIDNPTEKTLRDYREEFRNISDEAFRQRDIRRITEDELREYLQDIVEEKQLTEKRLYKFKSCLNLLFRYAVKSGIITANPVPSDNVSLKKHCRAAKSHPEEKAFQPNDIRTIQEYVWSLIDSGKYSPNYYAILLAIETGMREAELPSLKWSDIHDGCIHIHSQQLDCRDGKNKRYYYVNYTKNERGRELGGRKFPVTENIRKILEKLGEKQTIEGIDSEFVFAKKDGDWMTTKAYDGLLRKITKRLGISITNNHAFRIALNSYVLEPMGLPVAERARLLGHSVATNLKHYTMARDDRFISEIRRKIDEFQGGPRGTSTTVPFEAKRKSPQTAKVQAFS